MRLILSVAVAGGTPVDVVAECAPGARVGDLAAALAARGSSVATHVRPAAGHLGVVEVGWEPSTAETGSAGRGDRAPAPDLWWRGAPLDPAEALESCPLRHGAVVGLGGDPGVAWAEPAGTVEVRRASGPEAGRVHRLGPGRHVIGTASGATVQLADPDVPDVAVLVEVDVAGVVRVTPGPDVVGRTTAPPRRTAPLEGPIVVRTDVRGDGEPSRGRRRRPRGYAARLAEARRSRHGIGEVDPEADRPLVHLDRVPLDAPRRWTAGQSLVVGSSVLEVGVPTPADASLSPSPAGATLDYTRPPRLLPPDRPREFRLPAEPAEPGRQPFPVAMMILPVVMGGALFWFTRSPYSLMIMALSPAMAVSNWVSSKRSRRGQHLESVRTWVQRTERIESQAYAALTGESAERRRDLPDPATVLLFATGPRARLWERRRTDPDWMLARVGTGDVPSEVSLHDPGREEHERVLHWTAADVPVAVPLAHVGVTGVAGAGTAPRRIAAWMVAQVAAAHSPSDVSVVLLCQAGDADAWAWVRWLPHVRREEGALAAVGNDDETTSRRIAELLDLVQRRQAAVARATGSGMSAGDVAPPPVLVVLDGARTIRLLPGLVTLLRDGPRVGVFFLCLDEHERQLPEECRAVIQVAEGDVRVSVSGAAPVEGVRPDLVPSGWFERLARALAPVRDVSTEDLSTTVPASSRLLDVLRLETPTPEAIASIWARGGRTTRAVIGETGDGVFAVDVRTDGPHGLVAGTTGSGKSELLQTLIASLAVANRPDEMTFVLVDYKGGAAFKDCRLLPHTVGMVTDLDAHLTTRALESLSAELRRREHQLAGPGAKDIEDYLAAKGPHDEPMPRLLLVIDEFAALVAELPEFVSGLVDIARRGRSLGVHLLLATQRPAGVVSAEIKSNTNLRIALRVTDANDSQDVIESGAAAEIPPSLPGRAYARLGHSSLVAFQAARVGGRPPGSGGDGAVDVVALTWDALGRPLVRAPRRDADDADVPTDLATLVDAVRGAATRSGARTPPPPWLPALPDRVQLADLAVVAGTEPAADPLVVPYGLVDVPAEQRRGLLVLDLVRAGNLAIVGSPRSGRSTALRTLAAAVGARTSARDVHVYGVDCGNNALLPLQALPHTGAVVTRDQPDRLARLTRRLRTEIARRQQVLAEEAFADVTEQRAGVSPDRRLPYLLVLLDRWEGFLQAFEDYDGGTLVDQWVQILQEGPAVGVRVVLTGDRSLLVGRVSTLTEDRVMLRMAEASDYGAIGMSPKEVPSQVPDGRGFRSEDRQEVQVALLAATAQGAEQVAALNEIARRASADDRSARAAAPTPADQVPFRVDVLPARVTLAEALELDGPALPATAVPAGVGGDALALYGLDAEDHGPGLLVVGPRRSGRSTALVTMATSALARGWRVGAVTPRRSPVRDLAGRDGVVGVLGLEATADEVATLLADLDPGGAPTLLVVDDLELVGNDGMLADAVAAHVSALRDRPGLVAAAGSPDELSGAYRGPVPVLKRSRSGIVLAPTSPNDGDLFGVRLPRSVLGGGAPGRGLLVTSGAWQLVQVPLP